MESKKADHSEGQNAPLDAKTKPDKWKSRIKILGLLFRAGSMVLSFVSLIVMVTGESATSVSTRRWSSDYSNTEEDSVSVSYEDFKSTEFFVKTNVLVSVHSGMQIAIKVLKIVKNISLMKGLIPDLISFIIDQVLAYLMVAAAAAGAFTLDLDTKKGVEDGTVLASLCKKAGLSCFCNQAGVAIGIGFISFIIIAGSAVLSGYQLFKRCTKYSSSKS